MCIQAADDGTVLLCRILSSYVAGGGQSSSVGCQTLPLQPTSISKPRGRGRRSPHPKQHEYLNMQNGTVALN